MDLYTLAEYLLGRNQVLQYKQTLKANSESMEWSTRESRMKPGSKARNARNLKANSESRTEPT